VHRSGVIKTSIIKYINKQIKRRVVGLSLLDVNKELSAEYGNNLSLRQGIGGMLRRPRRSTGASPRNRRRSPPPPPLRSQTETSR